MLIFTLPTLAADHYIKCLDHEGGYIYNGIMKLDGDAATLEESLAMNASGSGFHVTGIMRIDDTALVIFHTGAWNSQRPRLEELITKNPRLNDCRGKRFITVFGEVSVQTTLSCASGQITPLTSTGYNNTEVLPLLSERNRDCAVVLPEEKFQELREEVINP
jgi:hypothetical protein